MSVLSLDDLPGRLVADRYRLEVRQATGLLSAVFLASDLAAEADPVVVLLQLRRPWAQTGKEEAPPPVELHDFQLLGGGFTADILLPTDVEAASGMSGLDAAAWLVAQTDAALPETDGESTLPGLLAPFEHTPFESDWLGATDHDELMAGLEDFDEPGGLDDDADGTLTGGEFDTAELTDAGANRDPQDTASEIPVLTFDHSRPR